VKNVWIPASPSLVLLGPHVMLFHREASSACVHLAGRGNCAKTVSEFIVIFTAILYQSNLLAGIFMCSDQLVVCLIVSLCLQV
jgi:hypothetical protein